jgi:hypothetical protein
MSQSTPASNVMQEFDTEFLVDAPEIYIFSACRHVIELVLAAQTAVKAGELDESAFAERVSPLFAQLRGLAQATQRFDIVMPFTPEAGFSPSFWRWFNWWHDYREGLSPKKLQRIHKLQHTSDPDALKYRPPGDWLKYRETPPSDFPTDLFQA